MRSMVLVPLAADRQANCPWQLVQNSCNGNRSDQRASALQIRKLYYGSALLFHRVANLATRSCPATQAAGTKSTLWPPSMRSACGSARWVGSSLETVCHGCHDDAKSEKHGTSCLGARHVRLGSL